MCEKLVSKRYRVYPFVAFLMVGLLFSPSYGEEASQFRYGFSVFGGRDDTGHNKPRVNVYGLLPRFDLPLYRNWHLEFEGIFLIGASLAKRISTFWVLMPIFFLNPSNKNGALYLYSPEEGLVMTALARG